MEILIRIFILDINLIKGYSFKIGKYPITILTRAREIVNDYNDMLS